MTVSVYLASATVLIQESKVSLSAIFVCPIITVLRSFKGHAFEVRYIYAFSFKQTHQLTQTNRENLLFLLVLMLRMSSTTSRVICESLKVKIARDVFWH